MENFHNEGVNKIAYLGVDLQDETTGYRRYKAYEDFVNKNRLKNISKFGDFSYKTAYNLTKELVKNEVEAIVCATDNLALGVRKYLTDKNITNIRVSGVGNNELMEFFYKDHISVNLSYKQAGTKAANLIFDMVNNISVDKLIVMESELIKG